MRKYYDVRINIYCVSVHGKKMTILLKKGTLWNDLIKATNHAIGIGALLPSPTDYDFIEDSGVRFFVRILTSLARKDKERKRKEEEAESGRLNPFLPYEKDLFVSDVSETHVALLNKFNVVEHHLLIVTREFEDQETLLTPRDFEALWTCLLEYDGLGFYNGGEAAGASQPHKHLQVVPLPLAPEGLPVPMEPLLAASKFGDGCGTIPGFSFLHAFMRLDSDYIESPEVAAEKTFTVYRHMLNHVGMKAPVGADLESQSLPYCLLVSRKWILLVPRSREFFKGISINALGYAGALLVRSEEQMEILKRHGPMTALKSVALPAK